MTIEHNAYAILAHLASIPRDAPATGHDLTEATSLDSHDINDAMRLLVDSGWAEWFRPPGTAPFDFGKAEITSWGRHELEESQRPESPSPSGGFPVSTSGRLVDPGFAAAAPRHVSSAARPQSASGGAGSAGLSIFVGCSGAAKSQAKAIIKALRQPGIDFVPWWEAFTPGRTLLEELESLTGRVGAALLLFSPESETTIRGNKHSIPNLNVLFEFGYFSGHMGRAKVGMLKYGEFYLPSDFGGYIHITGSKFFKRGSVVRVGKRTRTEFTRWIEGM